MYQTFLMFLLFEILQVLIFVGLWTYKTKQLNELGKFSVYFGLSAFIPATVYTLVDFIERLIPMVNT